MKKKNSKTRIEVKTVYDGEMDATEMFVSLIAQRCGRKNIRDSLSKKKETSYTEDDVQKSPIPSGLCG